MHEMVELISVSNALQANQRVIQTYDSSLERAVQVLGTPN
jgi:flagellar basal body rod protein FlgG